MASINSSSLLTPPCFDILKTPPPTTLNDTDLLVQDIIETPPHYQCGYPRCTLSFPTRAALSQHTINLHTESYVRHPLRQCLSFGASVTLVGGDN
ncbi:hypothetical protein BC830DRAFT_1175964 [Chytriomyces sp. MP71]|nr:hypothetical protein BC830DRAFT_1175964 [Chytriomyces sp. MP71]